MARTPTAFTPITKGNVSRVATIRRLRSRRRGDSEIEVDLSPLIDCVFLLLIFFLVTTMLKKLEKQIPVVLPDYTVALAPVAENDVIIYAITKNGEFLKANEGKRSIQGLSYRPITSLEEDLALVSTEQGTDVEIRIDAEREVPVQTVIDALDTLALQGFEKVGVRLRHREREFFELRGGGN
ncbi:ExbD/TolR family protein [Cerasicoccus fimbriatus]|uniref:ExbD/TolR family protein n=1 Tax=Cerasicoccus fimbriatus TaxID=3014554 RepID=UPI0022B572C6|nr:biopolymer transporter ExbD [Cerasicoccus sp. TK19100]